MFDEIIAPIAREVGIELTFAEARRAAIESRALTDEDLELVIGGAGFLYSRIIAGTIAATMAFSSMPAAAFAREPNDTAGHTVQTTLGQESTDDTDANDGPGYHRADPEAEHFEDTLDAQRQAAYDAISSYSPDCAMSDIALPEGIVTTEDGLVIDDAVTDNPGSLTSFKSSKSDDVSYTTKDLGYVVKDAMGITSFGKNVFELITKEGASQYFTGALVGGKTLLKLIGAIEGDNGEESVSNADLQNDIRELHGLLQDMNNRLDEGVKQIYQNRLTPFDNGIGALNVECAKVEQMYRDGYQLALERDLIDPVEPTEPEPEKMPDEPEPAELPEEPALELPEEPISWYDLVQKSYNTEEADNKWWPMLDDWARRYGVDQMDYVSDFEVRQSQYRQAHAAWEAECEPLRAEHVNEIEKWQAECDRLNAEHDQINEYVKRLHGNSALDDLGLAGLYNPAMEDWWNDAEGRGWFAPCGVAFRAERGSSKAHARILTWDGKVVSKATATKADDHWASIPTGVLTVWARIGGSPSSRTT